MAAEGVAASVGNLLGYHFPASLHHSEHGRLGLCGSVLVWPLSFALVLVLLSSAHVGLITLHLVSKRNIIILTKRVRILWSMNQGFLCHLDVPCNLMGRHPFLCEDSRYMAMNHCGGQLGVLEYGPNQHAELVSASVTLESLSVTAGIHMDRTAVGTNHHVSPRCSLRN